MINTNRKYRIGFLDGLRGIAILLVVLFHAYGNPFQFNRYPYGDTFAGLISYGWVGVQLFFMISGFVIFMTLEKCHNFSEFICRRWFRLFPAMLMCSVIIFMIGSVFPERLSGPVFLQNLLPGITFIDPFLWTKLLGIDMKSLETSFWSLYVEVKFYIIFGILYFSVGWRKAVLALIGIFLLSTGVLVLREFVPAVDMSLLSKFFSYSGMRYYGWFVAGSLYYKYFCEQRKTLLITAMLIAFISALVEAGWQPGHYAWKMTIISTIAIVVLFTFATLNTRVQTLLSYPVLLFFGFISYPLYLLHENMMVAMICNIGQQIPSMYKILMPMLPIAVVIGLAWLVAAYIEPWTRERLRIPYKQLCTLVKVTRSTAQ